jgi:D-alanyl-D-alanine dipeptidase
VKRFFALALLFCLTGCHRSSDQLTPIQTLAPDVRLDIRYATQNNFTHQKLYDKAECLLRPEVAEKLAAVQRELNAQGLGLKVFDCYRPLSIQRRMWAIVPDDRYVADPAKGSRHNRGAAVDLTLVRSDGVSC